MNISFPGFSVPVDVLKLKLNALTEVASGSKSLPILNNVYMRVDDKDGDPKLTLAGTNLEVSLKLDTLVTNYNRPFTTTAPYKLLKEWVAAQPAGSELSFTYHGENETIEVRGNRTKGVFKCLPARDYPNLTVLRDDLGPIPVGVVNSKEFSRAIRAVTFAAGTDSTRPLFTGCSMTFENKKVVEEGREAVAGRALMVCTDSFRLATFEMRLKAPITNVKSSVEVIPPARCLIELLKVLPGDEDVEIAMNRNKSQLIITGFNFQFTSSLIEGLFPNYRPIIPTRSTTKVRVLKEDLSKAADLTAILTKAGDGKNKPLVFQVVPGSDLNPGIIFITSHEGDNGAADSAIDAVVEGAAVVVGINNPYLQDLLKAVDSDFVTMEFLSKDHPIAVSIPNETKERQTLVIMPMVLREEKKAGPGPGPVESAPAPAQPEPVEELDELEQFLEAEV